MFFLDFIFAFRKAAHYLGILFNHASENKRKDYGRRQGHDDQTRINMYRYQP